MELLYTKIFIKNFHIDWMTFHLTKEHACSGFVFGFVLCGVFVCLFDFSCFCLVCSFTHSGLRVTITLL